MEREMINKSSKNNKKGFTLVELIATIVVLALVVGISSYACSDSTKVSNSVC